MIYSSVMNEQKYYPHNVFIKNSTPRIIMAGKLLLRYIEQRMQKSAKNISPCSSPFYVDWTFELINVQMENPR